MTGILAALDFDPRLDEFDPARPEVIRDPYPWFDRLRTLDPAHRGINGLRFLTRFADIDQLLRDHRTFVRGDFADVLARNFGQNSLNDVMGRFMFALDPPDHTRLRRLVAGSFTREKAERLRPRMRELAAELLDEAVARGGHTIDVLSEFAYPLPLQVVCEILGVPPEDREMLRSWTNDITPTVDFVLSDEVRARGIEAAALFKGYFLALISLRRRHRGEDLLSELLNAEEQGERLSERELISLAVTLLIAGHENVTNLVGNGLLALLRHPGELEAVRRESGRVADVVTETLRYDSPVTYVPRQTAKATRLGDVDLAAGESLVALFGAANRDPEKFPDPGVFRLDRPHNAEHLDFGRGITYCLGAPFAIVESEVAFETLLTRLGDFGLAIEEDELTWRPTIWARGLERLPITVAG
ncbi:cytochrome P450 [Nocardia sp. NPDC049526]|uniref:cytochrome P450 n=1 Tax=Nocardia sp. NPDC049526 TaxID=3364316 RepID=UPI0037A8B50C